MKYTNCELTLVFILSYLVKKLSRTDFFLEDSLTIDEVPFTTTKQITGSLFDQDFQVSKDFLNHMLPVFKELGG